LGSTVAVVVVEVVVAESPDELVDVEVDAVVVVGRFDAPLPAPVVFAVVPVAPAADPVDLAAPPAAAPPPLALPATVDPPAFGAGELTFGDEVGALPAPRPWAAVVVPSATAVTAVSATRENLRMM
jgi:hypothetical protein